MEENKGRRGLLRSTGRQAITQLVGVGLCTAILLLFAALSFSRITLPEYTAQYAQKDTQQVVNLIITVVATVIGILLSHCRRLTNEAETKSELRNAELTIPRLHVHVEAAGGSHAAVGVPALHNKQVWGLVAFYLFAMIIFGFLNSVLSVIFVIESVISDNGHQSPAYIPIGIDMPLDHDPCHLFLTAPGCSYSLGMTALSSLLVTYTPFVVGGVTFEPPNGTMGLPYWAMQHFTAEVQSSKFEEERRQYCLPVLDPDVIHCTEKPYDQELGRTNGNLVQYTPLDVVKAVNNVTTQTNQETYEIAVPVNASSDNLKYRTADQGQGTMLVRMYPYLPSTNTTVITAVDSTDPDVNAVYRGGYASLLYYLMYGVWPDSSLKSGPGPYHFVASCQYESIKYRDNYRSSWRKVEFTLKNGISRANVTEQRCPNPRGNWTSGFDDLYFDLEGAADVMSSTDGYCKLFNINKDDSHGTNIFQGMSRFDAIVNKMLHITSTSWTQQSYSFAMQNQSIYDQPVMMTTFPHLYIIRIDWTPTTYVGLVLAILITLNMYLLAGRWLRATYRFGWHAPTWNLLRPVDLMAYSLAAYQDLIYDLNTMEHRKMAMDGTTRTVLHETPIWEGTQSLIGLVKNQVSANTTAVSSPISPVSEKPDMQEDNVIAVTVDESNQGVSALQRES